MNSVLKNVYIEKLDHIADKYSNTYYGGIKMKPTDVKSNTHVSTLTKKNNDEDSKFEVGDHVKISTCKNNFVKGYTAKWFEEVFMVRKVKSTVS